MQITPFRISPPVVWLLRGALLLCCQFFSGISSPYWDVARAAQETRWPTMVCPARPLLRSAWMTLSAGARCCKWFEPAG